MDQLSDPQQANRECPEELVDGAPEVRSLILAAITWDGTRRIRAQSPHLLHLAPVSTVHAMPWRKDHSLSPDMSPSRSHGSLRQWMKGKFHRTASGRFMHVPNHELEDQLTSLEPPNQNHILPQSSSQSSQVSSGTTVIETQPPKSSSGTIGSFIENAPECANVRTADSEESRVEEADYVSLWDRAYDALREEQPELLLEYEKLLSRVIDGKDASSSLSVENEINQTENHIPQDNSAERQSKMVRITQLGLEHMEDETTTMSILGHKVVLKDAMATTAEGVDWARKYVNDAIKDVPYAPAVMAGISLILPLFKSPSAVEAANREGLAYVVSQMRFYSAMEPRLLEDQKGTALREDLVKRVQDLYKLVTDFQIRSILWFYRNGIQNYFRAVTNYDEWDRKLGVIKNEQQDLSSKLEAALSLTSSNHLKDIQKTAERSCEKLSEIHEAIEQFVVHAKDNETQKFLDRLQTNDPSDEMEDIEEGKGDVLPGSTDWVFKTPEFQQWLYNDQCPILWVKGDPGKGKTMLLCGIIRELSKPSWNTSNIVYFFCKETDTRIATAVSVLRGLIYMFLKAQPSLVSCLSEFGERRLQGPLSWVALRKALQKILDDPRLRTTYVIIDGLDECVSGRDDLIRLITTHLGAKPWVKWLVSSRNLSKIENKIHKFALPLSLENNEEHILEAIDSFIEHKVQKLAEESDNKSIDWTNVLKHLSKNADGTFLWVELVCNQLTGASSYNIDEFLMEPPSGLKEIYQRQLEKLANFKSEPTNSKLYGYCKRILSVASLVRRPVTLKELAVLADLPSNTEKETEKMISECSSILVVRKGNTVRFVHQSAKEYLLKDARLDIFPDGLESHHRALFSRSLQVMAKKLSRDIYDLREPGYLVKNVKSPSPDPLESLRYACVYWVDHLHGAAPKEQDLKLDGILDMFLQRDYLHWIEALSLLRSMSIGVFWMLSLEKLVTERRASPSLIDRTRDAYRFIQHHKSTIEEAPLQAYASALVFSPTRSITRNQFSLQGPGWIEARPMMEDDWNSCLLTLEGHKESVQMVSWASHDRLASASFDGTVKMWDISTNHCLSTFNGNSKSISSIGWLHDSELGLVLSDGRIETWDTTEDHSLPSSKSSHAMVREDVLSVKDTIELFSIASWSHQGTLAFAAEDGSIWIRAMRGSKYRHSTPLKGRHKGVYTLAWSGDGRIASGAKDGTIKIWNAANGRCKLEPGGHSQWVYTLAWSQNSQRLASGSRENIIKIWDTKSGRCTAWVQGQSNLIRSLSWSPDGRLAGADGEMIRIWDSVNGKCLSRLEGHSHQVWSVAWSADGARLASASRDATIKIWDVAGDRAEQPLLGHSQRVNYVAWSTDKTKLASVSEDDTVIVWEACDGGYVQKLTDSVNDVHSVAWSKDDTKLALATGHNLIVIWDIVTGEFAQTVLDASSRGLFAWPDDNVGSETIDRDTDTLAPSTHPMTYGIDANDPWITSEGKRELRLPPGYNVECSAILPGRIGIGCGSGRVLTFAVSEGISI